MQTTDFDYDLPESSIAQTPLEPRDSSRLLVLRRDTGELEHRIFREIGEYLAPGDLLVLNQTRVIPARIYARKETGGRVELLLLRRRDPLTWEALVGGKGLNVGKHLLLDSEVFAEHSEAYPVDPREALPNSSEGSTGGRRQDLDSEVFAEHPREALPKSSEGSSGARLRLPGAEILELLEGSERLIRFSEPIEPYFSQVGNVPLPPYIHEKLRDPERYQTVYAQEPGSAAAPTAGLHFTPALLEQLQARGIRIAYVTLHVGLDTFAPVTEDDPEQHKIHTEWCELPRETAGLINATKREGHRVVAVGTTSVRTLESASKDDEGVLPFSGPTSIYILPGYRFHVVDAMITNFHLPKSTLIMLVSAFAGRERILSTYRVAIREGYRFYSFGDAMLIT